MAANVFAKMPQRNCHNIVVILIYALVEWILILLLLINSLFSHLIQNFAIYFSLKPSCTWCTRLDHLFDSRNKVKAYRNNVCESHGIEIAKLSYCANHGRLGESKNLCDDCSSFSMNEGMMQENNEGINDVCSCCDEIMSRNLYNPPLKLFESSCDVLDYICKNTSAAEVMDHAEEDSDQMSHEIEYQVKKSDTKKTEFVQDLCSLSCDFLCDANLGSGCEKTDDPIWNRGCNEDDESLYITDHMLLQNEGEYLESDGFICIELIDTNERLNREEQVEKDNADEAGDEGLDNFPVESEQKEGSLDVSIISETEHLKASLKAQEKAMNELYSELEEERKSAAISANQTMAMINKLQEEKSAMQMEAMQYQRMMEEQAEYDQEALQLLNDLVLKREKEKQELEKELEIYRNKFLDSFDIDFEGKNEDIRLNTHQEEDNSVDDYSEEEVQAQCIKHLTTSDISLAEFDEERLCILEELKALEAKLFSLHDDDETKMSRKRFERKTMDQLSKKLLPLFDDELADEEANGNYEMEKDRILIKEGLSHVYDRLQALEADKEFVKHCISSMMKGNKGIVLLQQILQHLRDLRSVEHSFRKLAEIPLA